MRPGALPVPQLILLDLVAPPILAGIFWADVPRMGRGSSGRVNERKNKSEASNGVLGYADPALSHVLWSHHIRVVDLAAVLYCLLPTGYFLIPTFGFPLDDGVCLCAYSPSWPRPAVTMRRR